MKRLLFILALVCMATPIRAQVAVSLMPVPAQQFLSSTGVPLAGGCIFSYTTGTSTPQATYADSTGLLQNANPLILDGGGFGQVWLDNSKIYRIKISSAGGLNCASGQQQRQIDGVTNGNLAAILGTNNTWTGNQTLNGNLTVLGNTTLNTLILNGALTLNGPFGIIGNLTATAGQNNINAVSLNGHFWAGPGPTPTIDTQRTAAIAAGGGVVDIAPGYTGAESSDCSTNGADGNNVWSGNKTVTIVDWRSGSAVCSYSVSINSATSLGLTPVAITKFFSSPSTTASAAIFTAKYTNDLSAGGGNLNGATSETDVVGTVTVNPTATMTAHIFEAHVRSLGGTLPDVAAISAGCSIDRAATTTSVTRCRGVFTQPGTNNSSSGATISESYGGDFSRETVGASKNYSVFSHGRTRFGYFLNDNGFDLESTSGIPVNILQNDGTDTVSHRPLTDVKGQCWKTTANVSLFCIGVNDSNARLPTGGLMFQGATPSGLAGSFGVGYDSTTGTEQHNSNNAGVSSFSGSWQCTNVTPVTVSASTTNDQNLMTCTVPAGVLNRVGRSLRVHVGGVYSTAAGSTAFMTLKAKLCTVSGCGSGTVVSVFNVNSAALGTITVTNDPFNVDCLATTQTAGITGAFETHGNFIIDLGAATTAAAGVFPDQNAGTVGTIDTTAQLFLQISGAFSAASASNAMTERQLVVETVN